MSFISVTFAGLPVSAYQDSEINYVIVAKEVQLYKGDYFAALSQKTRTFPRSFDCYTEDYTEISNLAKKIGTFETLTIEGENFSDCYISDLELSRKLSGIRKFTYSIKFSRSINIDSNRNSVLTVIDIKSRDRRAT